MMVTWLLLSLGGFNPSATSQFSPEEKDQHNKT
jgi:hypothetical protein